MCTMYMFQRNPHILKHKLKQKQYLEIVYTYLWNHNTFLSSRRDTYTRSVDSRGTQYMLGNLHYSMLDV